MNVEKLYHTSGILYQLQKPSRYIGHEWNRSRKKPADTVRFLLVFPDLYEIGMSHLGLRILYHKLNDSPLMSAEMAFLPWTDLQQKIRDNAVPLFSLDSFSTIDEFDVLGFTLQYELAYPGVAKFLELSNLNPFRRERKEKDPIIIAGGPCVYNPEPMADIIDAFFIGDAEEGILEIGESLHRTKGKSKRERLSELAQIAGVYVPAFYVWDGECVLPEKGLSFPVPFPITKRIAPKERLNDLNNWIVPFFSVVHDRSILEIQRGCTRGCRFCQAGMVYRPVRECDLHKLVEKTAQRIQETGYEEMSLLSLSTLDYSQLSQLLDRIRPTLDEKVISLSIPSSRMDQFGLQIADQISQFRKTGLTFAPEAGSQRLRNVINKNLTEEEILCTARSAKEYGWSRIKLYYMVGLPTEREEDIKEIVQLTQKIKAIGFKKISVSIAGFVPKPHTPFQFCELTSVDRLHQILHQLLDLKRIASFELHKPEMTWIEGILARGDRDLGKVIVRVAQKGNGFEALQEEFTFDRWIAAMEELEVLPEKYTVAKTIDARLPWDAIDSGIRKEFLISEYQKALFEETTSDCREGECSNCGVCR